MYIIARQAVGGPNRTYTFSQCAFLALQALCRGLSRTEIEEIAFHHHDQYTNPSPSPRGSDAASTLPVA
jgi:hypothetical protein